MSFDFFRSATRNFNGLCNRFRAQIFPLSNSFGKQMPPAFIESTPRSHPSCSLTFDNTFEWIEHGAIDVEYMHCSSSAAFICDVEWSLSICYQYLLNK